MRGCLLVNLGTPDAPTVPAVRRYLAEFLMDPRVIDMPALFRALLVYLIILPFRPKRSAAAYAKVWDPVRGSPLAFHTADLAAALQAKLGGGWKVAAAMRYGQPSIRAGLDQLDGCEEIVVLPMFPQYAEATTGSVIEAVTQAAGGRPLRFVRSFHVDPGWVNAVASLIRPALVPGHHLVMSFHGLPERQVRKADPTKSHCLVGGSCCETPSPAHATCYRAQCLQGARAIAASLGLAEGAWSVGFQSRVGRDRWLGPSTEELVRGLVARGQKDLVVACPAFLTDCLETVEEIGDELRHTHAEAGGGAWTLVPCVNADPAWVEALAALVDRP